MILLKFMLGHLGPSQHLSLHLTELLPFGVEARWGSTELLLKNPPLQSSIWPNLHFPYSPLVEKRPPDKHSPSLQCLWYSKYRWYLQKLRECHQHKIIRKRHTIHEKCIGFSSKFRGEKNLVHIRDEMTKINKLHSTRLLNIITLPGTQSK